MNTLPTELISKITEYLIGNPYSSKDSLLNFALTCKHHQAIALPLRYRDTVILLDDTFLSSSNDWETYENIDRDLTQAFIPLRDKTIHMLEIAARNAKYARTLRIEDMYARACDSLAYDTAELDPYMDYSASFGQKVRDYIGLFSNVQRLDLCFPSLKSYDLCSAIFLSLHSMTALNELKIMIDLQMWLPDHANHKLFWLGPLLKKQIDKIDQARVAKTLKMLHFDVPIRQGRTVEEIDTNGERGEPVTIAELDSFLSMMKLVEKCFTGVHTFGFGVPTECQNLASQWRDGRIVPLTNNDLSLPSLRKIKVIPESINNHWALPIEPGTYEQVEEITIFSRNPSVHYFKFSFVENILPHFPNLKGLIQEYPPDFTSEDFFRQLANIWNKYGVPFGARLQNLDYIKARALKWDWRHNPGSFVEISYRIIRLEPDEREQGDTDGTRTQMKPSIEQLIQEGRLEEKVELRELWNKLTGKCEYRMMPVTQEL